MMAYELKVSILKKKDSNGCFSRNLSNIYLSFSFYYFLKSKGFLIILSQLISNQNEIWILQNHLNILISLLDFIIHSTFDLIILLIQFFLHLLEHLPEIYLTEYILVLVGVVGWIIAWLIGPLVSAAVSRQREYLADATGAEMTRYPQGLASALKKLGEYGRPMRRANSAMAHMYINDPLKPGMVERVFSTHPPIPDRIKRLAEISRGF